MSDLSDLRDIAPGPPPKETGPLERPAPRVKKPPQPIRPRNNERMEKRNAEAFAEQADACRKRSCLVARCRNWPCVPHHVRTRGAGGKDADTVPLCWEHHEAAHGPGFEEKHGLDLAEEAAKLGAELERRRGHDCEAFAVLREDASKESSRYVCDRCGCVLPDAQEGPDA